MSLIASIRLDVDFERKIRELPSRHWDDFERKIRELPLANIRPTNSRITVRHNYARFDSSRFDSAAGKIIFYMLDVSRGLKHRRKEGKSHTPRV